LEFSAFFHNSNEQTNKHVKRYVRYGTGTNKTNKPGSAYV